MARVGPFFGMVIAWLLAAGCGDGSIKSLGVDSVDSQAIQCGTASSPPAALGLDGFYRKYLNANGIPVVASSKVSDLALAQACTMTLRMLGKREDVLTVLRTRSLKVAILAQNEVLTEIPEYRDLNTAFPWIEWDKLRGVGATSARPTVSSGEENLLCLQSDPHRGEFTLPSTMAHSLLQLAFNDVDSTFESRLRYVHTSAIAEGRWMLTSAAASPVSLFVAGVQDWFDANKEAIPANGTHNQVNTRAELQAYEPALAQLLSEFFPTDEWRASCP